MMLIAGTVPIPGLPLTVGSIRLEGGFLEIEGRRIPCTQGTGAMIGAALTVTDYLKLEPPHVVIAGDIGEGRGSRAIYEYLADGMVEMPQVLAMHYLLPVMGLMRQVCQSLDGSPARPILIADAGSMYAAKAAGLASKFDVFTPDVGELAFLADPQATHPAYVRKSLFEVDNTETPALIVAAFQHHNAPRLLLVKGATDYVADRGEIVAVIREPNVPELEPIGGTGDTITGLLAALVYAGWDLVEAAVAAAKANRIAGKLAKATPATRVKDIIAQYPTVFKEHPVSSLLNDCVIP